MKNILLKIKDSVQHSDQDGFTIVETLVALAIFSSSIVFLIVVSGSGVSNTTLAKSRLTATYLAEEGIELARNLRDTNVLSDPSGSGWNTFISNISVCDDTVGCNIDPSSLDVCACTGSTCNIPYSPTSGYFGYSTSHTCDIPGGASPSPFTRTLNIVPISETTADDVLVTSAVTWNQGASVQRISYQTILMDWEPHVSAL